MRTLSRSLILVLVCILLPTLNCQDNKPARRVAPGDRDTTAVSGSSPFVAVAHHLMPSVVNISVPRRLPQLPRLRLRDLFRRRTTAPVLETESNALASGVIIDPEGYVLTNHRVVRAFRQLIIRLADGTTFRGDQVKLVGSDDKTDLSVFKLATDRPLPAVRFADSDSVRIGDWAIAVGDPYGLQGTVTVGVVSAAGRSGLVYPDAPSYQDFIQTDAAVNPGSTGGPLVNLKGEVIGINTVFRSPTGANIGIAFAIPSNTARNVSRQLIRSGRVTRGYIGVTVQELSPALREALGLTESGGVLITEVLSGTPAARAGLQSEDVVTEIDSFPVRSLEHFRSDIASRAPGAAVRLTVRRGEQSLKLKLKLVRMPDSLGRATGRPESDTTLWLGMSLRNLSSAELKSAGIRYGVKVEGITPDSPAGQAGVEVDDILTSVNRRAVRNVRQLPKPGPGSAIRLELRRGASRLLVTVTTDR